MSLYLKYRPKTFADYVGQHHIVDILLAQAKNNQLSQSYLLFGPKGTGKTSTARLLAKLANCTTFTADGMPDLLNDPSAQIIDENKTLDFVEIDAASHTGVDNVRDEIISKAIYPPAHLKKKVYVIDEVHMLSKPAFNALLKIMEEPPAYLMFVLATTELHKVPDTIVSRCQICNFKQHSITDITDRLAYIAKTEQIATEPEALRLIAKLSGGALRDAIKYLEQVSILGEVTQTNVATFLGVINEQLLTRCMELLLGNDPIEWMNFLDTLMQQGVDLQNLTKEILMRLDEHFLEQPHVFAALAGMFREINAEAKRYPHPLLLRKSKTWKRFEEQGATPAHPLNEAENTAKKSAPKKSSKKASSAPAVEPEAPVPSTEMSDTEKTSLMETLISCSPNPLITSALKQYAMIEEVTDMQLSIVVINEQFYHTLNKPETTHELQQALSEKLGKEMHLRWTHTTKEDRLAKQLQ